MKDKAYYESMTDNLDELLNNLYNRYAQDCEISTIIKSIDIDDIPNINLDLDLPLYRARYDDNFDNSDYNQFSYIHNPSFINMLRYNQKGEAVLYTSTNPDTAFKEIKQNGNSDYYLSLWRRKNDEEINCAMVYNPANIKNRNSNAGEYSQALSNIIGGNTSMNFFLGKIGEIMEIGNQDYRFSSQLASAILKKRDVLITTSTKSDGTELNITFNKNAADKYLEMKYVLKCNECHNKLPYRVEVSEIGVIENKQIIWYTFTLDENSFKNSGDPDKCNNIIQKIQKNPSVISPVGITNVNSNCCEIEIKSKKFNIKYYYKLI